MIRCVLSQHFAREFDVGGMTRPDRGDFGANPHAGQKNVAYEIHHFMAGELLFVTHSVFGDDRAVMHDDRVVETSAFDESGGEKLGQFAVDAEGSGVGKLPSERFRCDDAGEILLVKRSCSVFDMADDFEVVRRFEQKMTVPGVDGDRRAGGPVFCGGGELLEPGRLDAVEISLGGTVGDRRLRTVHFDNGVVDLRGVQRRHDMLNRYDESARCAGGNGRCAAYVDDVSGDCLHFGFARHIDTAEDDARVFGGGENPQSRPDSCMERDSGDGHFFFYCVLVVHFSFVRPC